MSDDKQVKVYVKNAGHCTRCEQPFGGNATAWMVLERVYWWFYHHDADGNPTHAFWERTTVPVCDACLTEREMEEATEQATCLGCGQRMRFATNRTIYMNRYSKPLTVCSNRCAQRERRKRMRHHHSVVCSVCKAAFVSKRADAKFCCNACRQRDYRVRARSVLESQSVSRCT
jgi:hypothetical protein